MRPNRGLLLMLSAICIVLPAAMNVPTLSAQQGGIVLTVPIPDVYRGIISEDIFDAFEAAHPGVTVSPIYISFESIYAGASPADLDAYLEGVQAYVSRADVLLVTSGNISVEATRAGYFLNLAPLTAVDPDLNIADFIPAAWQSFQWDGGVWALPASVDVTLLIYNPAAFDEAGLAYPDPNWTIDDLANAARTLAQRDAEGHVTIPGFAPMGSYTPLFRSLLGHGFYDSSTMPELPSLDDPALETIINTWVELEQDGVVGFYDDYTAVPLRLMDSFGLMDVLQSDQEEARGALLPGGTAGLTVTGFAVSGGTLYPDLAYELAEYLTHSPEAAALMFGLAPARYSLVGVQASGDAVAFARPPLPPEAQAVADQALAAALPQAELRYGDYLVIALNRVQNGDVDARAALQEIEAQAVANLQAAADRRETTVVVVATPVPPAVLQPGEISLRFGVLSLGEDSSRQGGWDQVIDDFVAADPQVGQIVLDSQLPLNSLLPDELAAEHDCFYLPYNAVPGVDMTTVLNLDPFLDADPTFDRNDVVGNTLAQLQRDNRTWAYPIIIQPQVLSFHRDRFVDAGLPTPEGGWTVDEFVNALRTFKAEREDEAPFRSSSSEGTYLLMLIAAYGGVPLDMRTTPPTINFTDPATVDAIRQVLDLAKDGLIDYQALANLAGGVSFSSGMDVPILAQSILGGFQGGGTDSENPYRSAPYPRGTQYAAASYDVGTAFISASTQNPDACYRWISALARHPELFSGMPARRSLMDDPAMTATVSPEALTFYRQFDVLISDPNTVVFPSLIGSGDQGSMFRYYLLQFWLNRAFDHYVLENADLVAELETAQTNAIAFQECVASIPPYDPASQDEQTYFMQYMTCATTVDPGLASMFGM